jgi:hypothetical protein
MRGVTFLSHVAHFLAISSSLLLSSCGKIDEKFSSESSPSFVTFHIRQVGLPPVNTQSNHIQGVTIEIEGCSHSEDNRVIRITNIAKIRLENLTESSTGCRAFLKSLDSPRTDGVERYTPNTGENSFHLSTNTSKKYTSDKGHELTVIAEKGLSPNLGRHEQVSIAILPTKKDNRLPIATTEHSFPKSEPLANLAPIAMGFDGVFNGKNAYTIYLDCLEKRTANMCGDINVHALRLRFLDSLPTNLDHGTLWRLLQERGPQVIPNESHHFGNGIRIAVATETPRSQQAGLIVGNGNTVQLYTFQLP